MHDLEVAHPKHNFLLPNGVVTSNSHSVCYVHIAYACAYLKHYYPLEWWCSVLTNAKKAEVTDTFWGYCGHLVDLPDVNKSGEEYRIVGDRVQAPVSLIKGVGEPAQKQLLQLGPYADIKDFCAKLEEWCVANKTPTIDKVTGVQKVTKKGQLCWRKGKAKLNRGHVHKLIAAGVMESLFPPEKDLAERIFMFETALSETKGEKKIKPVPAQYLTYSLPQTYLVRKAVLPVYTEPLMPLLLDGDPMAYPLIAFKKGAKPKFRHGGKDIPVISYVKMQAIDNHSPWPEDMRVEVAIPVYVATRKIFNWGPNKVKEACKMKLELDGALVEYVKWGDRKTGQLDAKYKQTSLTGSICLAIFSKWSEKKFGLEEVIPFHTIKEDEDDEEDQTAPED